MNPNQVEQPFIVELGKAAGEIAGAFVATAVILGVSTLYAYVTRNKPYW